MWNVFPQHLSARSLLCWHPPAVCTAPLHQSLCENVGILCMHKCTYLFHLYVHTSTTHTQRYHREESSGGFQILKSSSSMRSDLTESYLTRPTSCPPTTVHPSLSAPHCMLYLSTQLLPTFPSFFQVKCLHFPSLWVLKEAEQGMEVVGREGKSACHCYCSVGVLDVVSPPGLCHPAGWCWG